MAWPGVWIICGLLGLAAPGAAGAQTSTAPESVATTVRAAAPTNAATVTAELARWRGSGRLLDVKVGELGGVGSDVVLAVLDPIAPADARLGEGPGRIALLLTRDDRGELREVARNDRLVPCAQCGGIAGDPYSYAVVEPGAFTIITEGGSRERWSNAYSFAWEPARRTWILQRVRRKVTDRLTGRHRELTLTARDFGTLDFSNVDPAMLPQPALR